MGSLILNSSLHTIYLAANSEEPVSRLFGLDTQLLMDAGITALALLALYIGLSYLLFNPVRDLLRKRREKIQEDIDTGIKIKEDAIKLQAEYKEKMQNVNKEVEGILSETRKKALKQEREIVEEAKGEATLILDRANKEVELEKSKVKDEVKKEMIVIASAMAGKIIASSIDETKQAELIQDTLKEMGDSTWQS